MYHVIPPRPAAPTNMLPATKPGQPTQQDIVEPVVVRESDMITIFEQISNYKDAIGDVSDKTKAFVDKAQQIGKAISEFHTCVEPVLSSEDFLAAAKISAQQNPRNLPTDTKLQQARVDNSSGMALASLTAKKWPIGKTLRVYFLQGSDAVHQRVLEVASEWSEYANIYFVKETNIDTSDIRVDFMPGLSESQVGTDALLPNLKGKATMNLGEVTEHSTKVT